MSDEWTSEQQRKVDRYVEDRLGKYKRHVREQHADELAALRERHAGDLAALKQEIGRLQAERSVLARLADRWFSRRRPESPLAKE